MCQCVCCDCWWWNFFGVCCAGWNWSFFLLSCWLCKPIELMNLDPECCHICTWTGYGGNFLCYGNICCAPDAVKQFSQLKSGGGNTVVVVQQPY